MLSENRRLRLVAIAGTIGKLCVAGTVFAATIGGYSHIERQQRLQTPLPGAQGPAGKCSVWFVGSSSIYRWSTLARDMAPWRIRNRGVNGVLLDEIAHRFAAEQRGEPPAALVIYAGENDIASGVAPDIAAAELLRIVDSAVARWPDTIVVAAAIKPSPTRWQMRPDQMRLNAILHTAFASRPHARFLTIGNELLINGRPGPFYQNDGVHLTSDGYRRWAKAIRSALEAALPPSISPQQCGAAK